MPRIAVLDPGELAEHTGVRRDVLMSLSRRGLIPRIKTGKGVYFNLDRVVEALRRLQAAQAVAAVDDPEVAAHVG